MPVLTAPAGVDTVELVSHLSCIVGILPRERVEPQPIEVAVRMGLDLGPTGDTGDLGRGVDYAVVDEVVRFLAVEGRFRLIESLGLAVLRAVLRPPADDEGRAPIGWAEVRIAKPAVLREATPAVRLARDAAWAAGDGPLVDVPEVRAERRTLRPGEALGEGAGLGIGRHRGRVEAGQVLVAGGTVVWVRRDETGRGRPPAAAAGG